MGPKISVFRAGSTDAATPMWRQCSRIAMAAVTGVALAACVVSQPREADLPTIHLASDEPQATVVGRAVLEDGGSAADAAAAMGLTLAVTLPSRVGLAGGGACLIYDPETDRLEALNFLPRAVGDQTAAVPMLARGLFALQARHGTVRWQRLVAGAEETARFSGTVSRSFFADYESVLPLLARDQAAVRAFSRPDGQPLREGDPLAQPALAEMLGRLRVAGADGLASADIAPAYAAFAGRVGLSLGAEALPAERPRWIAPIVIRTGVDTLAVFPGSNTGGDRLAALARALPDRVPETRAGITDLVRDLHPHTLPTAPGAGLVVRDGAGQTVVCGLTMVGPFGTGRYVPPMGLFPAPAPAPDAVLLGGLALQINRPTASLELALAGTGLTEPVATILIEAGPGGRDLGDSVAAPRTAVLPDGTRRDEAAPGEVTELGRVIGIACPSVRGERGPCRAVADPRADGLAFSGLPLAF